VSAASSDDALALIAAAIGDDAAQLLSRHFGGTTVYVPQSAGEHHPLHVALGTVAVGKLIEYYGGTRISVPKRAQRQARVRTLHRSGALTIAGIAIETGYSERHVYRLLREARQDTQLDLFDQ
jgi:hypothetical protein